MSCSKNFKVSQFNYAIDCGKSKLIVNTLNRSITQLDKKLWEKLKLHPINENILSNEEKLLLVQNGVLVNKNTDELQLLGKWLNNIKHDTSDIKVFLTLTSRCNFNCSYCFERGYLQTHSSDMTQSTATAIIHWLKKVAIKNDSKQIRIFFYGGEPTLKINLIDHIVTKICDTFKDTGIKTEFCMFTNGSLLPKRLLDIIQLFNFKEIQITLDGPPQIHNKRRSFKDGRRSFDIIFKNIQKLLSNTNARILVLVNFDRQNQGDISELLDLFLNEKRIDVDNISFAYNPVFQTPFNRTHCSQFSLSNDEAYKKWRNLYMLTLEKNLKCNPLRIYETGPCSYRRLSHLIFDPKGNLYKCIGFLGIKELSVGNVRDEISTVIKKIENQVLLEPWHNKKCTSCEFLPLCLGGCRFHSYVEHGNIKELFCHQELIEKVEMQIIKSLHENEISKHFAFT